MQEIMSSEVATELATRPLQEVIPEEMIDIALLKPHPRNYNGHPDDQLEHIAQSLRENSVYRNVVVARDNTILAGHGVIEAAKQVGFVQFPVRRVDLDPDEPRALKILAGDNEISHLSEKDDRLLSELLKEIMEQDETGLMGTGYDEMMLANLVMVTRPASEIRDLNEAAEWVGMPEYTAGEDPLQAIVSFRSQQDRDTFFEMLGVQHMTTKGKTTSFWWPDKEQVDRAAVRFEG